MSRFKENFNLTRSGQKRLKNISKKPEEPPLTGLTDPTKTSISKTYEILNFKTYFNMIFTFFHFNPLNMKKSQFKDL